MTQIITITPNPAIDVSTSVGQIAPFTKMRCGTPSHHPGGGGVNVARVIKRLGGEVKAIYPAGGANGQRLHRLLDQEGIASLVVDIADETREDFTVFEASTRHQYRFVLPGPVLSDTEWQECLRPIAGSSPRPDFIVASGSLPAGVPHEFFSRIVRAAKDIGVKVVLDTSGAPLTAALSEGLYLIKPNLREFRELTGVGSTDDAALVAAARALIDRGLVEIVALSMGPGGALMIAKDRVLRAEGLPIQPASVVGAGDSFLGALVWILAGKGSLETALGYAVAAGSAALLNPGSELCHAADVRRLAPQVNVRMVG